MEVTVRCTGKPQIQLTVDPNSTVGQLKSSIASEMKIDQQFSLITKQILDESKKISEITAERNLVVIVRLGSSSQAPSPSSPPPPPPQQPEVMKAKPNVLRRTDLDQEQPEPEDIEDRVKAIQEMGFNDKQLVRKALRVSFYSKERAIEYLLSGHVPDEPTSAVILDMPPPLEDLARAQIQRELSVGNRREIANYIHKVAKYAEPLFGNGQELYQYGYILQDLAAFDWDLEATLKDLVLDQVRDQMEEEEGNKSPSQ